MIISKLKFNNMWKLRRVVQNNATLVKFPRYTNRNLGTYSIRGFKKKRKKHLIKKMSFSFGSKISYILDALQG